MTGEPSPFRAAIEAVEKEILLLAVGTHDEVY